MKYLLGSKEEFWKFVDSITQDDKVGIITHTDLDGFASAIFLEEILNSKNINVEALHFVPYKLGMFSKVIPQLEEKNITKLFLTDMYADGTDPEGFRELKEMVELFVIDHHPLQNKKEKNMIKTQTFDCSTLTIYDLGKGIIDEKWKWLLHAAMISDMSYRSEENLELIRKDYPNVSAETIFDSPPGVISKRVASALIYFEGDLKKIYDLVKNKNIEEFEKAQEVIDAELDKWKKDFKEKADYYPETKMYIYYFEPRYNISSIFSTILSMKEPDKTFVILAPFKSRIRLSARNQSNKVDMGALLKKGIQGLQDAAAGGHVPAAGGQMRRADLNKFKENLLK